MSDLLKEANRTIALVNLLRERLDSVRNELKQAEQEPPRGSKATWIWDDSPPEEFGQLYMPVCRVCLNGPLTGDEIVTGLCGEDHNETGS